SRSVAYLIRRRAELLALYQRRSGNLAGFVAVANSLYPISATTDNGIVGVFPFDALSWTNSTSQFFAAMTAAARDNGVSGPWLLEITGTATPLAKKNLAALGWNLRENSDLTRP